MPTGVLSPRQIEFAHHYSANHRGAEAARLAGYSATRSNRTAYELLHRPDVADLISTLDDEKREASGVDSPWIVDHLVAIVEASMSGRPRTNGLGEVILDRDGQPIVDRDMTNANRALATLSKVAGLQVRKPESVSTELKVITLTFDRELADDV